MTKRCSLIADAGVLRALAAAAGIQVELEAEILWLGIRLLFELHDHVVVATCGEFRFARKHVAFLLELDFGFRAACVGYHRDTLVSRGDGLQGGIVERNCDGIILFQKELGLGFYAFKEPTTFGTADAFLLCGIQRECRDANYGEGISEGS